MINVPYSLICRSVQHDVQRNFERMLPLKTESLHTWSDFKLCEYFDYKEVMLSPLMEKLALELCKRSEFEKAYCLIEKSAPIVLNGVLIRYVLLLEYAKKKLHSYDLIDLPLSDDIDEMSRGLYLGIGIFKGKLKPQTELLNSSVFVGMFAALWWLGEKDKAKEVLASINFDELKSDLLKEQAFEMLVRCERYDLCRKVLSREQRFWAACPSYLVYKASFYRLNEDYEKLHETFVEYEQLTSGTELNEFLMMKVAFYHYPLGEYTTALEILEQISQSQPEANHRNTEFWRAIIYGKLQKYEKAERILFSLSQLFSDSTIYFEYGRALYQNQKYREAYTIFQKGSRYVSEYNLCGMIKNIQETGEIILNADAFQRFQLIQNWAPLKQEWLLFFETCTK